MGERDLQKSTQTNLNFQNMHTDLYDKKIFFFKNPQKTPKKQQKIKKKIIKKRKKISYDLTLSRNLPEVVENNCISL